MLACSALLNKDSGPETVAGLLPERLCLGARHSRQHVLHALGGCCRHLCFLPQPLLLLPKDDGGVLLLPAQWKRQGEWSRGGKRRRGLNVGQASLMRQKAARQWCPCPAATQRIGNEAAGWPHRPQAALCLQPMRGWRIAGRPDRHSDKVQKSWGGGSAAQACLMRASSR